MSRSGRAAARPPTERLSSERSAASTRRSSPTGRTSTSRSGFGSPAAASPAQRRLEAFGRGYVLARYRVGRHGIATRAKIAALDWPVLVVHLLVRRELGPIRERRRGTRIGLARGPLHAPFELAGVSFLEALTRQLGLLRLRASGSLPSHFDEHVSGAR